jgi:hypothetical protein
LAVGANTEGMIGIVRPHPDLFRNLPKETEEMRLEPTKQVNGRMWPPGQSGNPNGRLVGSLRVVNFHVEI